MTLAPDQFAAELRAWLSEHADVLEEHRRPEPHAVEDAAPRHARLIAALWEAGWIRAGWPVSCGGTGGDPLLRGVLYDELWANGYSVPETLQPIETLAPALIAYAPTLAAEFVPRYLRGEEFWCQGFSEPDAGSDLASLRCRARREGDAWIVSGQKTWATLGHLAHQCFLLARTGAPDSRHRGLTMFFVDMGSAGLETRPIRYANGRHECSELFFDDVVVPADRVIGAVDQGWAVAMYLLQFERGMYAWIKQGWLHARLASLAAAAGRRPSEADAQLLGEAYLSAFALRSKCGDTMQRLARGESPGSEISVDKLLLGAAEQTVLDGARALSAGRFDLSDDASWGHWRDEWFYTRAATIYGGSAEVQRGIIADRVLGLPKEATGG